jgi:hypothetical protein
METIDMLGGAVVWMVRLRVSEYSPLLLTLYVGATPSASTKLPALGGVSALGWSNPMDDGFGSCLSSMVGMHAEGVWPRTQAGR